jgi:hypothetical protein
MFIYGVYRNVATGAWDFHERGFCAIVRFLLVGPTSNMQPHRRHCVRGILAGERDEESIRKKKREEETNGG